MAQSGSASGNWIWRVAVVGLVGGAGFIASNQQWIDISQWPVVGRFVTPHAAPAGGVATQTAEDVVEDLEIPEDLAAAQYEPETDPADEFEGADSLGLTDSPAEGVTRAMHEEEADAAADESLTEELDEEPAPRRVSAGERRSGRDAQPAARRKAPPSEDTDLDADEPVDEKPYKSRKATQSRATPKARQVSKTSATEDTEGDGELMELSQIDELIDANELVAAQKELSRWYFARPKERGVLQARLNKLSQTLYFASTPHIYEPYVVESGDQLRTIGKKYNLSWEYLAKLNRVAPSKIRQGQKLKVVPGPFGVIVSLSRFELTVHLDGSYVKHYRVGVGKDGSSPVGTFVVKNKQVDPTYFGPDGVIRNDDPENPLGERWIDIGDSFGIHGTNEPDSIGKAESRGCIRMKNEEVAEVYDFLVVGSKVKIER